MIDLAWSAGEQDIFTWGKQAMWSEKDGCSIWAPPPKKVRFLFVPTLFMGSLGILGAGRLLVGFTTMQLSIVYLPLILVGLLFALFMVWIALVMLTLRLEAVFDPRARRVYLQGNSLLWSKRRTLAFDEVRSIRIEVVRGRSNAHQINPVGTYAMVMFVNPESKLYLQLSSERLDVALPLARKVSELVGVPIDCNVPELLQGL